MKRAPFHERHPELTGWLITGAMVAVIVLALTIGFA